MSFYIFVLQMLLRASNTNKNLSEKGIGSNYAESKAYFTEQYLSNCFLESSPHPYSLIFSSQTRSLNS